MKIKNIKINNYGNLENKEINLNSNINIIYGKNESGKSTLLNYIKNIFYGISKNKNGREISDYEKYKPWMKEDFSGKLNYELDSGEGFEIFRDFNKKNPKIYNDKYEDISKDFMIDKKDGSQYFFEQTKVDETMFLSTIVSMQQEVKLDRQSEQVLVQRIANLAGTGDDNISLKKVLDKLNKKQVDEIGTERTQGKPINIIKDRIKEIELSIKDIKLYKDKKIDLEKREEQIKNQINLLEIKNNIIKKLSIVNSEIILEKEKLNIKNKAKQEINEKIEQLNLEKNKLLENINTIEEQNKNMKNKDTSNKEKKSAKNRKTSKSILLTITIILFILIKLLNMFFIRNNYLDIFSYIVFPIVIIYLFIKINIEKNKDEKIKQENKLNEQIEKEKLKNEINIINIKIENINEQINQYIKEQEKQIKEIEELQRIIDNKIDLEIEKIKIQYKNQMDIDEILNEIDFNNIQIQLSEEQEKLNKAKLELHSIILEEKEIFPKLENIITLQAENTNLNEELLELEKQSQAISLTKDYLNRAYEKMKEVVTPKFTQNLSKNIGQISNGKYTKVNLNDENGLIVENKYGEYIPIDRLSIGTIDQLYLSLRLSMIDDISEEKMPIILDEAFAYYDETRLENIIRFLVECSSNHQIIILTCTKREQNILENLQVQYNLVEL